MTDSEKTNEYAHQSTLGVDGLEQLQTETSQSLESLKGRIELTPAELKAINTLPDYNENASDEEQEVRKAYFIKMKSDLLAEITRQGDGSPLSQVLQEIPIMQKRSNGVSERKVEGEAFEKLIIYLGNKNALKSDLVACNAIDIRIWLQEKAGSPYSPSGYLTNIREDYLHRDEIVKYKEIKEKGEEEKGKGEEEKGKKKEEKKKQITENKPIKIPEKVPLGDGKGFDTKIHLFESGNGFNISTMKSYPFERSPDRVVNGKKEKGTTLCSMTTRLNLEMLGLLNPPRGDALAAMLKPEYFDYGPLVGSIFTDQFKQEWKEIRDKHGKKDISKQEGCMTGDIAKSVENMGIESYANCGEIYLSSKSVYGHRAAICKGDDDERYVLDPYVGGAGTKPQLLKDYLNKCESKGKKVYRINLFQSQA